MHTYIFCFILFHNKHTSSNKSLDFDTSMNIVLLATETWNTISYRSFTMLCLCISDPNGSILNRLFEWHYCKGSYFTKQWPFIELVYYLNNSWHISLTNDLIVLIQKQNIACIIPYHTIFRRKDKNIRPAIIFHKK